MAEEGGGRYPLRKKSTRNNHCSPEDEIVDWTYTPERSSLNDGVEDPQGLFWNERQCGHWLTGASP